MVKKKAAKRTDSQIPPVEVIDTEGTLADAEDDLANEPDSDGDEDEGSDEPGDEEFSDHDSDLDTGFETAEADSFEAEELDAEDVGRVNPVSRALTRARTSSGDTALSTIDPLAAYMREVQRHPLLTREEEHHLAVLYHETGDVDAAKKLVTSNLRLVVKIAYEYKRAYRNMMDLVQEGNIGLMQAVKRFDPHRGVKLSSYSAWWIRAYILRFILNNWRLVKLGTTQAQRKLFFNLNKERARLSAMGIEPTHEEIAKRLEVDTKDVREMDLRLSSGDSSLDVPVGEADGTTSRLDLLRSPADSPEVEVSDGQVLSMLKEQLGVFRDTLQGKDLIIFDRRMVAEEPVTLQELGVEFGVSRERVRQLEARISGKLRTFLEGCLGDPIEIQPAPST